MANLEFLMKKIIFILTILTLNIANTKAQNRAKIDSLLQTLTDATDSMRVNALNGLAEEYLLFNVKEKTRQAQEYVDSSLTIARELSYTKGLAAGLRNQGTIHLQHSEIKDAKLQLFQSLALEEDLNNELNRALCLKLIGSCYELEQNYKTAINYYKKAYDAYRELRQDKKTASILIDLAELHQQEKENEFAEIYASHGLETAQKFKLKEDTKNAYQILAKIYKATRQFDQAYEYQEKYSLFKDSIAKEERLAEITKLEANHKAQQEELLTKKRQEQRNNLQYLGISAFFILLFGGLFFVGDVAIPPHMMRRMIFIALFLTFQFLLLLLNPILQEYAGGVALFRLLINGCFALGFVFLIKYLEKRINMRLEKRIRRRIKKRVQKKMKTVEVDETDISTNSKSSNKGMQSKMATS